MRPAERGFTLVELLVSLAITGAAAGLLVAALGTGRNVAGRLEGRAAAGETVAAAQDILRERIERLLPDTGGTDGTGAAGQAETVGTAGRFTFIAPAALNRPGEGMQRFSLALGRDGTLDLAATDARRTVASWRVDPLIGNVAALDLAYYGAAVDGAGPRWQAAWVGRADPPTLVRVRVRFGAGDARSWPDLLIRPVATVSTACTLDFNTGACRAS